MAGERIPEGLTAEEMHYLEQRLAQRAQQRQARATGGYAQGPSGYGRPAGYGGGMPGSFAPQYQAGQPRPVRGPAPQGDPRARYAPEDTGITTVRSPKVPKREEAGERKPRGRRIVVMGVGGVAVAGLIAGGLIYKNDGFESGSIAAAMGSSAEAVQDAELKAKVMIANVGATALDEGECRRLPKENEDGETVGSAVASVQVTGAMPLVPVWTNAETEKPETPEPYLTDAKLSGDLAEYITESGYQEFLLDSYPLQFYACQVKGAAPAVTESEDGGYEINRSSISIIAVPATESRAILKPGDADPKSDIAIEGLEKTISLDPETGIYASMPRTFMYPVTQHAEQSQAEFNDLLINKDQSNAALQAALDAVVVQIFGGHDTTTYPDKAIKTMTDLIDQGILERIKTDDEDLSRSDVRFAGSYNRSVEDLTKDTDPELKMVSLPGDPYERVRVDSALAHFGGIEVAEYVQPEPSEEPKDKEE